MNEQINEAIKSIEVSLKALTGAEEILAQIMGNNEVPSVKEPEPASEPTDVVEKVSEVFEVEDITPPRTDLVCPCDLQCKVYDNRPNKRSGQYKPTAPDFTCSNNTDCPNQKQGHSRMLRKSWWLDSKDLPQEWINTTKIPQAEDTVQIQNDSEDSEWSPFS